MACVLYYLYEIFHINLFHYLTVRATIGFFIAFLTTLWLMPRFIRWAQHRQAHQPIYEYAPKRHQEKARTPTMGGAVFISATIIATLLSAQLFNPFVQVALLLVVMYATIGMSDDLGKILKRENKAGLAPKSKFWWQMGAGLVVSTLLVFYAKMPTELYVPFVKNPVMQMGFLAIPFWALVMVAASNAVNLTDGLDGLATVPSVFAFLSLMGLAYITGNAVMANYLLLPKIIGVGELMVLCASLIGALLGFLWYNCNPAEVFMGDSGSLAIGGLMGFMGVVTKSELLLFAIGFIFVLETVSVIIQVGSFKLRGKRVFLMAPIHHHFEMKNWAENKIIVRFWIISLIANIIAAITIKLR
ncbi:MAG: phospho-N-acetylmuramoyl-pentapeptide-transferase [Campylobacterales bacterium]